MILWHELVTKVRRRGVKEVVFEEERIKFGNLAWTIRLTGNPVGGQKLLSIVKCSSRSVVCSLLRRANWLKSEDWIVPKCFIEKVIVKKMGVGTNNSIGISSNNKKH